MLLFRSARFLPLFLTQFFGALNDNLLKNAMVILLTYGIAGSADGHAQMLVTLAGGLFILPFFLLSATAGQMADKYDRATMTRWIKAVEIVIMAFASVGFLTRNVGLLFLALFGMGVHSTFFGPIKYALLPQQLSEDELLPANSYIEAGTFLSILIGTILGGVLILQTHGALAVCAALFAIAIAGYLSSRSIPAAPSSDPTLRVSFRLWKETRQIIGYSRQDKSTFLCILGISWFWFVGATLLSEFAPYAKDVLHAEPAVVTLLLTVFSVGIALGSFFCERLLRGQVKSTYVPLAALAITLFGIDLFFGSRHFAGVETIHLTSALNLAHQGVTLLLLRDFIAMPAAWRVLGDLCGMAISAGLYIVPLYAIMQQRSAPAHRARIIAANNVVNALFMVASALLTLLMLSLSFTIPDVFLAVAIANGIVAIYICKLLRGASIRSILRTMLNFL